MKRPLLIMVMLLAMSLAGNAQTWTGTVSTDWFTQGNWNPATVPIASSSVIIPGSLGRYPILTGNVTIATLNMASGSQLDLNSNDLLVNGNTTLQTATIDGGGTFTSAGSAAYTLQNNIFTTDVSITGLSSSFSFYNNKVTGNLILGDAATNNSGAKYIDNNIIVGNFTINHAGTGDMYESYNGGRDSITGNATFNISGSGDFNASYGATLNVGGNLTINRTAVGATQLYRTVSASGAFVGGNFSYTGVGGGTSIGNGTNQTNVAGTFNISIPNVNAAFGMTHMTNNTAGGTIAVKGATSQVFQNNDLKANVNLTAFRTTTSIYGNTIMGDLLAGDSSSNNNGAKYIDNNIIVGNFTINHAGTGALYESYNGGRDSVTGNATFNISGTGDFNASYGATLNVGGNLTINRTAVGATQLYRTVSASGAFVGGNFSYTGVGGGTSIGNGTNQTNVAGTFNISIPNVNAAFGMTHMTNNTAGGTIAVKGATSQVFQNNELKANVNLTAFRANTSIYGNTIMGNLLAGDSSSNNNGAKYIDLNLIMGDFTINHAGTGALYESYNGGRDSVTGNATFNISGTGDFYSSYAKALQVGGNLTVNRTAVGYTQLYRDVTADGAGVGGNFSFAGVGGPTYIGHGSNQAVIAGTFSISIPNVAAAFGMTHMTNNTAGGTIVVNGATSQDLQDCTLRVNSTLSGYTSNSTFYRNVIIGNTTIGDAGTNNSNAKYLDGNTVIGDLNINYAGGGSMTEGYGSSKRDSVTGNVTFNITGGGDFVSSYDHSLMVGGDLTILRPFVGAGGTTLYATTDVPATIGGDFNFDGIGPFAFNNGSTNLVTVNGKFDLINTNAGNYMRIRNVKNLMGGGVVDIDSAVEPHLTNCEWLSTVSVSEILTNFYLYNNKITGNTIIGDALTNNSNTKYLDGNTLKGNLAINYAGGGTMLEGYGASTGDSVTGDATFNITGTGTFQSSYSHVLTVGGDLTLNRTGNGYTHLYMTPGAGSTVGGNISLNNTGSGTFYNGNTSGTITIGGTIDVNVPNLGAQFSLQRFNNLTAGGTVKVQNATVLTVIKDTLLANVELVEYNSSFYMYDNKYTGNTSIKDKSTNNSSTQYIDGNIFNGNLRLEHSGTGQMFDGYGSTGGNRVTGIDSIFAGTTGALYMSYSGHIHQADSSIVLTSAASGLYFPALNFGGSTNGTYTKLGFPISAFANVELKKTGTGTLTLNSPIDIGTDLKFTGGYLQTNANNLLHFTNGATATGAGNQSHVIGPVKKTGAQAFVFPLGDGDAISTIAISAPSPNTAAFIAEYKNDPPQSAGYDTSALASGLNHVSRSEYWLLDRTVGTSAVFVTLGNNLPNSGFVTNQADLRVAHWDGTQWLNEGNGGTTGTNNFGTVKSAALVSNFSPFTLASSTFANPLPIKLQEFSARKVGATAQLDWETQDEKQLAKYELQHSANGNVFETLVTLTPEGGYGSKAYAYNHTTPLAGINYYRVAMVDEMGGIKYSPVRSLDFSSENQNELQVYPNPATDLLHISGLADGALVKIISSEGRVIQQLKHVGKDYETMDLSALPSGLYYLKVYGQEIIAPLPFLKK